MSKKSRTQGAPRADSHFDSIDEVGSFPQREAIIDLEALSHNSAQLAEWAPNAEVMAVVKADAYGHGLVPAAQAFLAGGANRLGTALIDEALVLRASGISAPIMAWLASPGAPYAVAIRNNVELAVYSVSQLHEIQAAAEEVGRQACVHLKVDTGMWRGGARITDWPGLVHAALAAEAEQTIHVIGIWSHLACADEPGHRSIRTQLDLFADAITAACRLGLRPEYRHIANSAATLSLPESHMDMVRPGIACYGFNPIPQHLRATEPLLRPAMTLAASIVQAKKAPAGAAVSYGHTYVLDSESILLVVPLGYADGMPRLASSRAEIFAGGRRMSVAGRVCMDQFVVDAGTTPIASGERVIIFGPGDDGEPTAADLALAAETIPYEVLTRVSSRVPRRYTST